MKEREGRNKRKIPMVRTRQQKENHDRQGNIRQVHRLRKIMSIRYRKERDHGHGMNIKTHLV